MSEYSPIIPAVEADELRDSPRKHVLMHATIIGADGQQRVLVKDLTATGARVQCEYRLPEGLDVMFKRGDQYRAARVAWVKSDEAGLQFYRELT